MRALPLLLALATPAAAETDLGALVAAEGLRGAEATLAALPDPTPSDRLSLGGVRFLAGIERALQLRYAVGLSDGLAVASDLPILRLPLPENPGPEPFRPEMIETLFRGVESDMAGALDALGPIGDAEAGVRVDLADLWLDVDGSGARSPGEGLADLAGSLLGAGEALPAVEVRFDTADAAWLAAYAHLLSALAEGVLAVGPTEAIAEVAASREALAGLPPPEPWGSDGTFGDGVDVAAMALMAIEGPLDPVHVHAARDHLLACIEENRRVWRLVGLEADDDAEWIPSKRQHAATGLPFPPETGALWTGVLAEAEGVLTGRLLLPWWRVGPGAGIDLAAVLEDPPALDLVAAVQGAAWTPYLRAGRVADGAALWQFGSLMGGDSLLYAVLLN